MLEAAGISIASAIGADVDERALEAEMADAPPAEIAQALAAAKASAVSAENPGALVLGGDSLVMVEGERFDKPRDRDAAAEHLRFFSGKPLHPHSRVTGGSCGWVKTSPRCMCAS